MDNINLRKILPQEEKTTFALVYNSNSFNNFCILDKEQFRKKQLFFLLRL